MCDKPCPCEACRRRRNGCQCGPPPSMLALKNISNLCNEFQSSLSGKTDDLRPSNGKTSLSAQSSRPRGQNGRTTERYGSKSRRSNDYGIKNAAGANGGFGGGARAGAGSKSRSSNEYGLKNATAPSGGFSGGARAGAGAVDFLKEAIGIIGFCLLMTFCLLSLIAKFGIDLLSKINRSDKRVRNAILVTALIISLVVFQAMLLRKVKHKPPVKKITVKLKPQSAKIIVAQPIITRSYWYTVKNGVTTVWVGSKEIGYKMKVRVVKLWPVRSKSCQTFQPVALSNFWCACKRSISGMKTSMSGLFKRPSRFGCYAKLHRKHSCKARSSFWKASAQTISKMKSKVVALYGWPFGVWTRYKLRQKPSFWSSFKLTVYKVPATIMGALKRPFRAKSPGKCSCAKKCAPQRNWKFWSNWHVGSLSTGWLSLWQKVKSTFTAPQFKEDPVAREVMRKSKLYAIPMEMKRPPQLLVCLRNRFLQ